MTDALKFTESILDITLNIGFIMIAISLALLMYQIIIGPNNANRAIALDTIGVSLMAVAGLMSIQLVTVKLNDIVLLIGILAFLGTVGIAKYYEEGVIIDRD
ncbi:monovalent cation/H+ antiporter complex subunit F [Oceanobacillus bengalensis]|uniref:Na(+)/H(+) antiporter subunit F n=1 Tax=Oceanobacillus bengalensis TaxID=1435466 RepID=A0A494Z799_9BACI|nr:monovalent cation/H+ antiporter complex subunit F [Oceanobacillus bengalensis]RKQ17886.1 Na(+)/H(+) antiporter subunit F [Oceanobacillus bengalensis]